MKKYEKITVKYSAIHFGLMFLVTILLGTFGYADNAYQILFPFLLYALLSFILPLYAIVNGIKSFINEGIKPLVVIFVILCTIYEIAYWILLIKILPAWFYG